MIQSSAPEAATRLLLSGNEAIARAALAAGVALGTGYPGTPSTEILENFGALGGRAQWAPNEKVAFEVGLGAAFAGARVLVTMKHVGLNVAADPLFTAMYTGVSGAFVLVSADDPGMASSQNEQDNRHYAEAAGIPMLEPADAQEAYDFTLQAFALSERWKIPVMLRVTTRVCHSKTVVRPSAPPPAPPAPSFTRDIQGRVMIPAYARPAHRRLRQKLAEMAQFNDASGPNVEFDGDRETAFIANGVAAMHTREAIPGAALLKLGMTWPLPLGQIRDFVARCGRVIVVEEGENWLADRIRAAGIPVESKPTSFRFGELDVARIRRITEGEEQPDGAPARGKPPQLCTACPHRTSFDILRELDCIVAGDIGCYTLGVLPPFEAIDTCVCMGASIGVGLGLRHALPPEQARRVVSIIGDSTFVHSGITGLVEMVYNPPSTGHVVVILDNGTTAMTGLQEHPGTGRTLMHDPTGRVDIEAIARAVGIESVHTVDPIADPERLAALIRESLEAGRPSVIVARRPCILAAGKIRQYEKAAAAATPCAACAPGGSL